jgi:hypothetical protein
MPPFEPLEGHGFTSVDCTDQSAANGRVGIRITTAAHRLDNRLLKCGGMEQLIERVLKRGQHPALIGRVAPRLARAGGLQRRDNRLFAAVRLGPIDSVLVDSFTSSAFADRVGNRVDRQCRGVLTACARIGRGGA